MKTARACKKCNLVIATGSGLMYAHIINDATNCCQECESAVHRIMVSGDANETHIHIVEEEEINK